MTARRLSLLAALIAAVVAISAITVSLIPGLLPGSDGRGTALIGGPFTLVDQTGQTVTEQNFAGRPMLVYFGYTFCPDVCPTELSAMSNAMDLLGDDASNVQPVFITIDPERDTVQAMADYVGHFHPQMVGLTGTPEQIAAAAKTYRVYYAKGDGEGEGDQYLMDHSSFIYLMGPDGKYLTHFPPNASPEEMAEKIKAYL